jgi:hypothetical protein
MGTFRYGLIITLSSCISNGLLDNNQEARISFGLGLSHHIASFDTHTIELNTPPLF